MNLINLLQAITIAVIAVPFCVSAQNGHKNSVVPKSTDVTIKESIVVTGNADADFEKLNRMKMQLRNSILSSLPDESVDKIKHKTDILIEREKINNEYKNYGLKLWNYYPTDNRRYEWFKKVVSAGWLSMHYWKNIDSAGGIYSARDSKNISYEAPIDWVELVEWEKLYPAMRKQYLKYLVEDVFTQKNLRFLAVENEVNVKELEFFLKLSFNKAFRNRDGNNKIDLTKLRFLINQAGATLDLVDRADSVGGIYPEILKGRLWRTLDNDFISCYAAFGLTDLNMMNFIEDLIEGNSLNLKYWAIQRKSLLLLKKEPFKIEYQTIDGRKISLEKMHGKVVLVDIWTTWCSSCIARMPYLREMYNKYRKSGFEVVSVCANNDDKINEVRRIIQRIGADWPVLLIGGSDQGLGKKLFDRYGFFGVPQLLLLDKDGKLVLLNDILRDGDIEPLLVRLLY